MSENTELLKKALLRTKQEVAKVIIGHDDVVEQSLIAIFCGQHALLEGVPAALMELPNGSRRLYFIEQSSPP